jgi:hypothetical protein
MSVSNDHESPKMMQVGVVRCGVCGKLELEWVVKSQHYPLDGKTECTDCYLRRLTGRTLKDVADALFAKVRRRPLTTVD